jgi:hypothetical protein
MRNSRRQAPQKQHWYSDDIDEGERHRQVFDYVSCVEREQFDVYDRFLKLDALYDPNANVAANPTNTTEQPGVVIENVVASCVDTVHAQIATSAVRPRVMTDDADWSTQRTAKRLSWYAEALGKKIKIHEACKQAFRSAAKKGTGIVKVFTNTFGEVKAEPVRIDDIVVDEAECRNGGKPRQMHHRMVHVDRHELIAMFPDKEEEILKAQTGRSHMALWAGYRPVQHDALVVIESYKLPIGRPKSKGYRPGRHTICIENCDLLDEDWNKPHFPYAVVTWAEREGGFYGISLSEGIAGIQRALNKRNLQIDRSLDQYAFPTTYVTMADANLAVQTINRAGSIVVHKGEAPKTVIPPAVSPEVYQHRESLKGAAYENSGVSRMASSAMKPAGLDSGVAMREYRDQTTQRFAPQEQGFEDLELQCHWLAIECCKELGDDAPVLQKKARWGSKKVKWDDVDMGDLEFQLMAASTLSRTPAGRTQLAMELAQAGAITTDELRQLIDHPDIERKLSMYEQAAQTVEFDIEAIEEGEYVSPEPFTDLAMAQRMGQAAYNRDRKLDGCPEEVLEGLRQYTVMAAHMLAPPPAANTNAMPIAPGALPPGMQPPADPMAGMGAMPPGVQPVSAMAPEAMGLVA